MEEICQVRIILNIMYASTLQNIGYVHLYILQQTASETIHKLDYNKIRDKVDNNKID